MYCQPDIVNALVELYTGTLSPRPAYDSVIDVPSQLYPSVRVVENRNHAKGNTERSSWEPRARQRHGQMSTMNRDERPTTGIQGKA